MQLTVWDPPALAVGANISVDQIEAGGFDSLVQTASGFNVAEAEAAGAEPPRGVVALDV